MPQPFGTNEAAFLDVALHSLLYGVYASIFTVYLRLPTRKRHGTLGYILIVLFTLITIFYMLDITQAFYTIFGTTPTDGESVATINVFTSAIYTVADYIAQSILIYRCWVMWGRRWWIISFPLVSSFMAFIGGFILTVFLGKLRNTPQLTPSWFFPLGTGSFAVSLGTNASVAVLLIIKLYQIHKQLKYAPDGAGGAPKDIRAAIGVFMETGVLMFVGQLLWVVLFGLQNPAFSTVGGPVTQIYGITPTLVIVRVASGMAYETAETRVENTTHFGIETNAHHDVAATNPAPRRPSTADSKTKSASTDHDIELGTI